MLRHRSTIKRARQDKKKRLRNRRTKSIVHTTIKEAKHSKTDESLSKAYSTIDTARKKGVLHRNTAARKKSRLAKLIVKQSTPAKEVITSKVKEKAPKKAPEKEESELS